MRSGQSEQNAREFLHGRFLEKIFGSEFMSRQALVDEVESQIVPKYRNYYVSYKQLLESIDVLHERDETADSASGALLKGLILPKDFAFGDTTAIFGLVEQRAEVRFVSLLQHEVSKLNHFTSLEIKTMLTTLRQLDRKLDRILNQENINAGFGRRAFPSATDEAELAMTVEEKLGAVYEKLISISDEVLILEHYVKLNIVILQRVIEAFDRVFSPPIGTWFVANLANESFANVPFTGLFSLLARLFAKTGRSSVSDSMPALSKERVFSISPSATLRAKLLLGSATKIQRAENVPETVWSSFRVPLYSEELGHESMRTAAATIRIVLDSHPDNIAAVIIHIAFERPAEIEFMDGTKRDLNYEELSHMPPTFVSAIVYEETVFSRARVIENIKIRKGKFSFESALSSEGFELDRGFVPERRQSVESAYSSEARYTRMSTNIILISSESVQAKFADLLTPLSTPFSMNDLTMLTPAAPSVADSEESQTPPLIPLPVHSPIMPHVHPTLPIRHSLSSTQRATTPVMATRMIHPKNFMANERSLLAWISATTLQSGIGLALLGKSGTSFIGALLCIVSLCFLWWSVVVFIKRFRQLRDPKAEKAHMFYSMDQCTVFGFAQMTLLVIQSLVFIWT
jgi:uncharacterized membrane protein YidH (DUF202 family)